MTLRSNLNPHLGEALPLRWSIPLAQFPRRLPGRDLFLAVLLMVCLIYLMARTDRCPSRPLSVPSRAILYPRSSRFPLSAFSSFLPTAGLLLLALSAQQLFYTRFWVIAIATTRARVWRSLPRTTACAPRPIE